MYGGSNRLSRKCGGFVGNAQSILIVDGNEGFATLLKQSLEQDGGYHAVLTTNADDALRALSATPFDLAIVDLGLENPDGSTLARAMRQQKADLRLMLIPIEGDTLPPEAADLNVQGVLPKPFFLPELPDRIADTLAKSVNSANASAMLAIEQAIAKNPRATQPIVTDPALLDPKVTPIVAEPESIAASDTAPPAASKPKKDSASKGKRSPTSKADHTAEVRERIPEIIQEMNALARDVNANVVLLSCKGRLLSHTGAISVQDAVGLAQATTENWRTAARTAEILGQELSHFEQSTEGGEHTFYSPAVIEDIILSIALNTSVPLGMIRHRAKSAADTLRDILNSK
jgi:CheY-like chemotaxis protein